MESVGSNTYSPRANHRPRLTQPVADRIIRALRHRIRLLHRPSASTFHVLGATGNVYTVTLAATPTCTCPDRTTPCKHILFVLIRALGVSPDDPCLRRRTIQPCYLDRLVSSPTRPDCLAGPALRNLFHQLFFLTAVTDGESSSCSRGKMVINQMEDETSSCPICLEEIINADKNNGEERGERVVACRVCKNVVHEECMVRWRRSRGRRPASCVICRARWRDNTRSNGRNMANGYDNYRTYQDKYLNLSAYVDENENTQMGDEDRGSRSCGG